MELKPPSLDEIEISVFGPGYGECAVIHLGNDRWIIVDSFLDTNDRPVALSYLEKLGVDLAKVELAVATHWDDDHIRGFAEIAAQCPNARIAVSAALQIKEFAAFTGKAAKLGTTRVPSGVSEILRIVKLMDDKPGRRSLANVDKLLLAHLPQDNQNIPVRVSSLSPSDGDATDFLRTVSNYAFSTDEISVKRTLPFSKNDGSVVLLVTVGTRHLLLAADMEKKNKPDRGWNNVLASQSVKGVTAEVFKVGHHGSKNSHEPLVWANMLVADPFSVIAPWRLMGKNLPTSTDVRRIQAQTTNLWVTAGPPAGRPMARSSIVKSELRNSGIKMKATYKSLGQVRFRANINAGPWTVELLDPACAGGTFLSGLAA